MPPSHAPAMREHGPRTVVQSKDAVVRCKHCRSLRIARRGVRKNKSGAVQLMVCKDCKKVFSANIGFRYRRHDPRIMTEALNLHASGMSVRAISAHFATRGVRVGPAAIYKWFQRYARVGARYMDSVRPRTGSRFRADEIYVKVAGRPMYLSASMDDGTRLWLASDLADKKEGRRAEALFRRTAEAAGRYPDEMATDGLGSYKQAARSEFGGAVVHVCEIHITGRRRGKDDNNKMGRLNGTIRDREKTFRGLGAVHSAAFECMRLHYNHVRRHGSLGGRTPGEAAGIEIEGPGKWRTIIQNGSLHLAATGQRVQGRVRRFRDDRDLGPGRPPRPYKGGPYCELETEPAGGRRPTT